MGNSREKRESEKTLDGIFQLIRHLDVNVWTGEKHRTEDIREYVNLIKNRLDTMLDQFKKEVKYIEPSSPTTIGQPNIKPWVDPVFKTKEWYTTPIVEGPKK